MTDIVNDQQLSYAEKIAALLRKAEATDNDNEADALTAKAQQLMIKYAITDELLAQAEGRELQDEIVEETIEYRGIFHMAIFDIGAAIARNNNVRHLIYRHSGVSQTDLVIIGFKSDVERVKLLDASIQLQATTAMRRWWKTQDTSYYTPMQKSLQRRQFLMSFATGVSMKLKAARAAGQQEAVDEVAKSRNVAKSEVQKSTELVLVSKAQRVDSWIDEKYGKLGKSTRRYKGGNMAAYSAGIQAGRNADVGQPRVGGRKALPGG